MNICPTDYPKPGARTFDAIANLILSIPDIQQSTLDMGRKIAMTVRNLKEKDHDSVLEAV